MKTTLDKIVCHPCLSKPRLRNSLHRVIISIHSCGTDANWAAHETGTGYLLGTLILDEVDSHLDELGLS